MVSKKVKAKRYGCTHCKPFKSCEFRVMNWGGYKGGYPSIKCPFGLDVTLRKRGPRKYIIEYSEDNDEIVDIGV